MVKKSIVVLIGNIGCGKSTIARDYINDGYVAIARDYLRYAIGCGSYIFNRDYEHIIWKTEQYMLRKFLEEEVDIVVDEVGVSKKLRKGYIKLGKEFGYSVEAIVLPRLSMKEAVDRRMKDPHGQFDRELWESVWTRFDKMYKDPTKEEGFNSIIRLKGGINGSEILS